MPAQVQVVDLLGNPVAEIGFVDAPDAVRVSWEFDEPWFEAKMTWLHNERPLLSSYSRQGSLRVNSGACTWMEGYVYDQASAKAPTELYGDSFAVRKLEGGRSDFCALTVALEDSDKTWPIKLNMRKIRSQP